MIITTKNENIKIAAEVLLRVTKNVIVKNSKDVKVSFELPTNLDGHLQDQTIVVQEVVKIDIVGGPSKVPDHVINPKKYTKYDLSDVSKEQMTDRSNTRAAFDFLNQLKTRNENEDDEKCQEVDEGKISFKKPIKKSNISSEASSSNVVKDGVKRVMPECVVGMKRSLEKSKTEFSSTSKKSKSSKNKIALSHLDDDEEDSD